MLLFDVISCKLVFKSVYRFVYDGDGEHDQRDDSFGSDRYAVICKRVERGIHTFRSVLAEEDPAGKETADESSDYSHNVSDIETCAFFGKES